MHSARDKLRERRIKDMLIDSMMSSGVDPREVAEWLWEDFGVKAKPSWDSIKRVILRNTEITSRDLAVAMIEWGVIPDEGIWLSEPIPGMQRGEDDSEG